MKRLTLMTAMTSRMNRRSVSEGNANGFRRGMRGPEPGELTSAGPAGPSTLPLRSSGFARPPQTCRLGRFRPATARKAREVGCEGFVIERARTTLADARDGFFASHPQVDEDHARQ